MALNILSVNNIWQGLALQKEDEVAKTRALLFVSVTEGPSKAPGLCGAAIVGSETRFLTAWCLRCFTQLHRNEFDGLRKVSVTIY